MKRKKALGCLLAALFVAVSYGFASETEQGPVGDAEQIIVDVREGRFISGMHEYPLVEGGRPITVRVEEGTISAELSTPGFVVTLELGYGVLAVTQQAAPYVTVEDSATRELLPWDETEMCPVCGQSIAIGRHYRLPCGHNGCLMTVDHPTTCSHCGAYSCNGKNHAICEYCEVAWCVHVDIECPYTRNPAPSMFAITPDDGSSPIYFYIDSGGSSVSGDPTLAEATKAPTNYGWSPGLSFVKATDPPKEGSASFDDD